MVDVSMRLMAVFIFCLLFPFNNSFGISEDVGVTEDITLDTEDVSGTYENISEEDLSLGSEDLSEEGASLDIAEESVEQPEGKEVKEVSTTKRSRVSVNKPTKKVSTPKSKKSRKKSSVKTGQARKSAMPKTAKEGAVSKKIKVDRSIVKNLGNFDVSGDIETFTTKANETISFIQTKDILNSTEKMDLYAVLARFKSVLGRAGFTDDDHYDVTLKVLTAATEKKPQLFSTVQMKWISAWKTTVEKEKNNPSLRKIPTSIARKKTPSRRGVSTGAKTTKKTTPTTKRATRRTP